MFDLVATLTLTVDLQNLISSFDLGIEYLYKIWSAYPSTLSGNEPPPHQLWGLGERCKLPQWGPWRSTGKFGFWSILGPRKSRQNGELAFQSGGQQADLGGQVPPAPT